MKCNCLLIAGAFLLTLSRADAGPIPVLNPADLANAADVVVLGRITSNSQVGLATLDVGAEKVRSRVMAAELHVEEILKGAPSTMDIKVRFLVPDPPVGYSTPPVGVSAIFFLTQTDREYQFTSPYYPSIVGRPSAAPESARLVDRLAICVGAAIESTETSSDQKRQAIFALERIPGPAATRALQHASHLNEPALQLSAAAVLLMRNDISGLQLAAEALLRPAEGLPSEVRRNLISAIGLVKDAQAVPTLTTLLKEGDDPIRRAAASALVNTASPSAIDPLAEALDDRDYQVRYYAVIGLAEITGQSDWRPNTDDFRNREGSYLSHWKEWKRGR
jgi:hypothetical protein